MIMRSLAALLCFLVVPVAQAAPGILPGDFGWIWPLELQGADRLWQVEATAEIHEAFVDPSRRDVAIFDARGEAVPMGRVAPGDLVHSEAVWQRLAVFPLPRTPGGGAIDVRLHVERRADGLHRLDAELGQAGTGQVPGDFILDTSGLTGPIQSLRLGWSTGQGDKKARFTVEASDDLERWTLVASGVTVMDLREDGRSLSRRVIDLPLLRTAHLRLRALDSVELPDLQVEALVHPDRPGPRKEWLEARLVSSEIETGGGERPRGVYTYEAAFAEVEEVQIVPTAGAALADVRVLALPPWKAARWTERGRFTLVQVPGGGPKAPGEPIHPGPVARRWRLEVTPPLDGPPGLRLAFVPDRYVFLLQGEGPWVLAAGSADTRGEAAPVEVALEEMRRREGAGWAPPVAGLGTRLESGGSAVATAHEGPVWGRWILWLVLSSGALAVALLALLVLRRSGAAQGPASP